MYVIRVYVFDNAYVYVMSASKGIHTVQCTPIGITCSVCADIL